VNEYELLTNSLHFGFFLVSKKDVFSKDTCRSKQDLEVGKKGGH
jgi:hypothetical protein